jgi:hypothetical protein
MPRFIHCFGSLLIDPAHLPRFVDVSATVCQNKAGGLDQFATFKCQHFCFAAGTSKTNILIKTGCTCYSSVTTIII